MYGFLANLSTEIINNQGIICVDDSTAKDRLRKHELEQSISVGFCSSFVTKFEYKSDWFACQFLCIYKWCPSTQIISSFGRRTENQSLDIRKLIFPICQEHHDPGFNASINLPI